MPTGSSAFGFVTTDTADHDGSGGVAVASESSGEIEQWAVHDGQGVWGNGECGEWAWRNILLGDDTLYTIEQRTKLSTRADETYQEDQEGVQGSRDDSQEVREDAQGVIVGVALLNNTDWLIDAEIPTAFSFLTSASSSSSSLRSGVNMEGMCPCWCMTHLLISPSDSQLIDNASAVPSAFSFVHTKSVISPPPDCQSPKDAHFHVDDADQRVMHERFALSAPSSSPTNDTVPAPLLPLAHLSFPSTASLLDSPTLSLSTGSKLLFHSVIISCCSLHF